MAVLVFPPVAVSMAVYGVLLVKLKAINEKELKEMPMGTRLVQPVQTGTPDVERKRFSGWTVVFKNQQNADTSFTGGQDHETNVLLCAAVFGNRFFVSGSYLRAYQIPHPSGRADSQYHTGNRDGAGYGGTGGCKSERGSSGSKNNTGRAEGGILSGI